MKATPQWLRDFLLNPQAEKPARSCRICSPASTNQSAPKRPRTSRISSSRCAAREKSPPIGQSVAAINLGRSLYHTVGCVQCHAPQDLPPGKPDAQDALAELAKTSVPMGNLAKKYTVSELAEFLRDPLKSRPGGRMPSLKLNPAEARAVAMYLLREQAPSGAAARLPGISYDYYEEQLPELPVFDRLTPKTSGNADTFTLAVAERKNDFALRFRGVITTPKDGEYEFFTKSDDGSQLFIDDQLVADNGGIHPEIERSGKLALAAGEHAIRVVYFDGGGQTALKVSWKGPGNRPEGDSSHGSFARRPGHAPRGRCRVCRR